MNCICVSVCKPAASKLLFEWWIKYFGTNFNEKFCKRHISTWLSKFVCLKNRNRNIRVSFWSEIRDWVTNTLSWSRFYWKTVTGVGEPGTCVASRCYCTYKTTPTAQSPIIQCFYSTYSSIYNGLYNQQLWVTPWWGQKRGLKHSRWSQSCTHTRPVRGHWAENVILISVTILL